MGKTEIAAAGKGEIVVGKIKIVFKTKLKLQWHFWAVPEYHDIYWMLKQAIKIRYWEY